MSNSSKIKKKVLGIIGGMGPEATVCMFSKIVKLSHVQRDQDHIEIFIHNNTRVPDRTASIIKGGPSPLKELIRSAHILQEIGADLLIIPCMTSHYYFNDLQNSVSIPIINAIEQAVISIHTQCQGIKRVGLLATTGTIKMRLFQNALENKGIIPVAPSEEYQQNFVMEAIYGPEGIKAGYIGSSVRDKLLTTCQHLINNGAEVIIGGCTEIPLAINQEDLQIPFMDPMEALAKVAVEKCLCPQPTSLELLS